MSSQFFDRRLAVAVMPLKSDFPKVVNPGSPHIKDVSRLLDRRIEVVVTQLENNSHQQIRIEEMARLVNLSPGRLSHLFKSETKVSIQQYLTLLRLARAKQQLELSFLSVKEIAASVGFVSVTRFAASFKNLVGTTPAQYRKQVSIGSYQSAEKLAVARSANT
jgi:transcriptional regulator GlxA family with amidase domain